ncbi:MAG: type II secretion system inner membrane protein GspF [Thermodesulfobacteriota bacterium]|nr:type II secretion system inner membrane protein GspF [Thermodesulfobacteriota bacterium]
MPVYEYTALDTSGKNLSGIIDADSAVIARQKLRGSGVFPVEVKEVSVSVPGGLPSGPVSVSGLFKRVKGAEVSVTTRQLSVLLAAGVPLVGALDALGSQIGNPLFKKIMAQIKESVNEGNSLAVSLSQHPKQFSNIYVNMVRAGEASGALDIVLARLAEYTENQEALKSRFKAAMAYPIVMTLVGSMVLFFLVTFVVPNITRVFTDMHHALPLPTVVLIAISSFFKSFWWALVIVAVGLVIGVKQFIKTSRGHHVWDRLKLRLPVLGSINQRIAVARFSRTLGTLLESGVPLLSALDIVKNIVNNILFGEAIDNACEEIEAGKSLAIPLGRSPWFPSIAVQMISVGEQSGELEAMLNKIADTYEKDVETQVMAMTSMLEPVMIVVMAVLVGFIVMSILLPIFEMSQMVQ